MKLIKEKAALKAALTALLKTGKAFQAELDNLLRSASWHVAQFEDDSHLNRLFTETATLCHGNTVFLWIEKYAPVTVDRKANRFVCSKKKIAEAKADMKKFEKALADAPDYYSLVKPVNPFKGFDFLKQQEALVKKASDYATGIYGDGPKKGEPIEDSDKDKIDVRGLTQVKRAIATVKGEAASVLH